MAPVTIREAREQAKRLTPLELISKVKKEDLPEVKVEYIRADGSVGKCTLPSSDYSSVENLLYCLKEFQEAATEYNWNGQVRFNKYRKTLVGDARETWDSAIAAGPANHQLATFNLAIREVIRGIAGLGSYDHLMEYMESAKKPIGMSPSQLAIRLSTLCRSAQYLLQEDGTPGPEITDLKQRRLLLSMCPNSWIEQFMNAGKTAATETIASIIAYMTVQYSMEATTTHPTKKQRTENYQGSQGGYKSYYQGRGGRGYQGRGRGRDYNRGGRGRGRGGRGHGRGNNNGRGTNPDAMCPIHGGHKWRKCIFNPNADADAPRLKNYRNQPLSNTPAVDRERQRDHYHLQDGHDVQRGTQNRQEGRQVGGGHSDDSGENRSQVDSFYSDLSGRSPFPARR